MGVSSVQTWPFQRWPDRPRRVVTDFMPPGVDDVGVYAWTPGPNYETPAEVRALRALGASAVGMSLAPELLHSQRLGIAAGAIAVITNACDRTEPMSHDDVVASAREQSQRLCALLRGYVAKEGGKS